MAAVAFVGLGAMGSRMARRLAEHGHDLVVWNRDPAKAEPLTQLGAVAAASAGEAAARAAVVLTTVADPAALRAVMEGEQGILAGATPGTTLIQMSTVGVAETRRLASLLPAGVDFLDAPVLGSLPEAESGTLLVLAGGPEDVLEHWRPLLSALGSVLHVGPAGAGSAAKLVANATLFGALGVLGEGLALAAALGLSRETAYQVLAGTPLAAQAERRRPAIESGEYPARFALRLALKDQELVLDAARAAGAELRLAEAARSWLADAAAAGAGEEDYAAMLRQILGSAEEQQ